MDTDLLISAKRQELWDCIFYAQALAEEEIQTITNYAKAIEEQSKVDREEGQAEIEQLIAAKELAEEGKRQAQKIAEMTEQVLQQFQFQLAEQKEKTATSQKTAEDVTIALHNYKDLLITALAGATTLRYQLQAEKDNSEGIKISNRKERDDLDKEWAVLASQREALAGQKILQDEIIRLRDQLSKER